MLPLWRKVRPDRPTKGNHDEDHFEASSNTPPKAVENPTRSTSAARFLDDAAKEAFVFSKIWLSSCRDFKPLERRIALCSHFRPNSRRNTPTTVGRP